MKLRIYIPTLGRAHKQITLNQMPDEAKKITTLVVHKDEIELYDAFALYRVVACPEQGKGIGRVRDWIMWHADKRGERYIMMLDDDLTVQRRHKGGGIYNADDNQYMEALQWVDDTLRCGIAACGLGVRFLQWAEQVKVYAEPARMMQSLAYDLHSVKLVGAKFMNGFDSMNYALMTDFNMTLQLLKAGLTNRVSLLHRITPRAPNAPGGCATWRTAEAQSASAIRLQKLHPEVVTLREKKGWNGMGPKMWDVNVQWRKALGNSSP